MKTRNGKFNIVAVTFSVLLIMSSGVQASGLFMLDSNPASTERQIGFFEQAFQWLSGAWTGLTSAFEPSEQTPPPPPSQRCTENCGDAGPGIDPIG